MIPNNMFKGQIMNAKRNLKLIHTVEGVTLQNTYDTSKVSGIDIGEILLPSGEIVMCDPERRHTIEDLSRKTFSVKVPAGIYPVILYMATTEDTSRIAFAEIRFNSNKPVTFVSAKSVYDAQNSNRKRYGYIVHDNQTGLMDAEAFKANCSRPKGMHWKPVVSFNDWDDDERNAVLPYGIGHSRDDRLNAIRLEVPKGCYYWYWGKDYKGNITCLVGDFFSYL